MKLGYFIRSASRMVDDQRRVCPNCGSNGSDVIERKAVVSALRRCHDCLLMFRTPIDDPADAKAFYQSDYAQGFTTDLPSSEDLERLKVSNWAGEKDYSYYISVLKGLGLRDGDKLFDFGCSWGYGSHQFAQAGFDTLSYEISEPRGRYGAANLGVRLVPDFEGWARAAPGSVDAFFSAHVLEHVPSPSHIIRIARLALKPGGLFVGFFPNGAAAARASVPKWSQLWGRVHPNFLDEVYLNAAVPDRPRLYGSSPIEITPSTADWLRSSSIPAAYMIDDLRRDEYFVAFRT